MKPKPRETDFEKVVIGEFITGVIEEIQRDENHKSTYEGKERISDCIRFKFHLNGCKFPHYSRWMTFNYGEKSNLYQKYLVNLVANAQPDMDFDIKELEGMKVKTIWKEKNGFQSIEVIYPLNGKLGEKSSLKPPENGTFGASQQEDEPPLDEGVPF